MKIEQRLLSPKGDWRTTINALEGRCPQLAFIFGPRALLEDEGVFSRLREAYPDTRLVIASGAGEIAAAEVFDDKIAVTAVAFEKSRVALAAIHIVDREESFSAGQKLAQQLTGPDLAHVFVLCDGRLTNGSQLARGFNQFLPAGVTVSGGLAGDGTLFEKTLVGLDAVPTPGQVVAVGLYGSHLRVGFGCSGGWVPFGLERGVTRSDGHTLFELDGQSALQLYKNYLGAEAASLPLSGLRFPLHMTPQDGGVTVVRTPHSIDEPSGSMGFAGDIPENARVRFLRASYEDLIAGAVSAATQSMSAGNAELALCVSCVARRVILGQRTEEELEGIRDTLGPATALAGFYSYGELAPSDGRSDCQFHNQTMTITTLREV
ncbi:MAG: FIST N-terminal domain-containing protein [Lacunisphaera sp.]